MRPTRKQPLFVVTGASGVGKSTACALLFERESKYIVMESDLLWHERYNTPEDGYAPYRRLWMRLCASISQIGKPVVLCGCALPAQFETHEERSLFTEIHYLAIVCDDQALEDRMRRGRNITDDPWIQSSLDFNGWLRKNAGHCDPPIALVDATGLSPEETALRVDRWIGARMG